MTDTPERKELWIDPVLRDFCNSSLHESPDPAAEHFLILYMMSHRIWNGDFKNWCDVPLRYLAEHSRLGVKRLQSALDHMESIGVVKGANSNEFAAIRRQPKRYQLMNKLNRWPTTPSSNPVVKEEVRRQVEVQKGRPNQPASSTPSQASPPPPKAPMHTPITTQPALKQETPEERWAKMTPAERTEWHRKDDESNKQAAAEILKMIADERKARGE